MIRVASVAGVVTVQDLGRPGFMHLGVPPGGALVKGALTRANAAVGNRPGAAALEVFGRLVLEATARARVATDDGAVRELAPGERATFASEHARVRYVALAGGFDVPLRLGSRSTLLVAGLGGHEGRPLRAGDSLVAATDLAEAPAPLAEALAPAGGARFRLLAGTEPGSLAGAWRVHAASDRVGVRLERAGADAPPLVAAPLGASVPMVQGALQVPPDGRPIVLGPDHPTTGGYPVLGFLDAVDFDRFFALPIGAALELEPALRARVPS